MLSDDIRRRLKKLNGAPLREMRSSDGFFQKHSGNNGNLKSLPGVFRKPPVIKASETAFVELDEAVDGMEISNKRGKFLLADKLIGEFINGSESINARYAEFFGKGIVHCGDKRVHRDLRAFLNTHPSRVLYLDIETTGLSATPLFLIGFMFLDGRELRIHQLFAREYCEEAPLLEYFSEFVEDYDCVVTFNGKSFDMPFIFQRAKSNMVDFKWRDKHLDVLHEGRRKYRGRFENCRLQTLEAGICGRPRTGDIPGAEIPDAYHRFVRTGNASQMQKVLHHNALDVITILDLLLNILSEEAGDES